MIEVKIKGPLKRSLGIREFQIDGGSFEEVMEQISNGVKGQIVVTGGKIYLKTKISDSDVKFRITIFYNGRNIMESGVKKYDSGVIEIITPVGGG